MNKKKKVSFFMAPNSAFDLGLNTYQLSIYLYLTRCNNNSGAAFPSFPTIAEKSGMGERKAKDVVNELVSMGLLKKQRRWGDKGSESNMYVVIDPSDRGGYSEQVNAHDALTPMHDMHPPHAPHALYKELLYKEPTDKEKTYIDFPIDAHFFLEIYGFGYWEKFNKNHPPITEEQRDSILSQCRELESIDIDNETFTEAVERHFENLPEKNDGKIFPFLHAWRRHFEI
ncbi:helix-turn-helix domain-containing protein [Paenibacillus sp. MBLB4367]|uniref:helix-turn-helix domain-containing protein n=1 Tax=Paenibacillus sp. MBLB4367 TaxID=3384767 RepID=UPI0039080E55